jgi:hypothetical protein
MTSSRWADSMAGSQHLSRGRVSDARSQSAFGAPRQELAVGQPVGWAIPGYRTRRLVRSPGPFTVSNPASGAERGEIGAVAKAIKVGQMELFTTVAVKKRTPTRPCDPGQCAER